MAKKSIPAHTRIDDESWIWKTYEPGVKIGQGTFGKVFKVEHKESGVFWAMKVVNKEKAGTSAVKLLEREVAILKRVEHENIISLNEVFETGKKMYLFMELCEGGELADALKARQEFFSEAETKVIVEKLASAISYLHKNDIVHRDLKLENILLSQNPQDPEDKLHIKVTDFGLSVVKGGVGHDNMMQDFCGTPIYMSPEIIDNKSYSQQCDVWAMGVIVYILLCGNPPFRSKDEDTLYALIKKGEVDFSDAVWADKSEQVKSCIRGMLKLDPAHRLTASEVLHHPWLTGESRDVSQPTNVLEMMKMWKEELKQQEGQNSAINGETEATTVNEESPSSLSPPPPENGSEKSNTNGKATQENTRKGSGGTKKPGSGGKSSSRPNHATSTQKSSLTPGTGRNTAGSKSPSPQKGSVQPPTKAVNNSNKPSATPTNKGRVTKK